MTELKRKWSLPVLAGTLMLVAACGGGGGGGGGGGDDNGGGTGPDPVAPGTEETGLSEPSLALRGDLSQSRELVEDLLKGYDLARAAVAFQQLGKIPFVTSQTACPSGGTVTPSGTGPSYVYTYNACVIEGFTFDGTVVAEPLSTGFRLGYQSLSVREGSTPLAANAGPGSDAGEGATVCTVANGSTQCLAEFPFGEAEARDNFRWGWDSTWVAGVVNGTHQCGCQAPWNVTYFDFDATSGEAVIRGSNGIAYVTRQSATAFSVRGTVNNAPFGPIQITLRS